MATESYLRLRHKAERLFLQTREIWRVSSMSAAFANRVGRLRLEPNRFNTAKAGVPITRRFCAMAWGSGAGTPSSGAAALSSETSFNCHLISNASTGQFSQSGLCGRIVIG